MLSPTLDLNQTSDKLISMKNLITKFITYMELGSGYSWSYRWYRIKELFGFIPSYYELTVIPTIVLGCLTNLGWYAIRFATEGLAYITVGEFVFAFLFFLVMMTFEDLVKAFVERLKSDAFFL